MAVTAALRLNHTIRILRFYPHMHVRGKSFLYEAQFPDGTREELLRVPFYDFYWQLPYILETPVELPSGTLMRATGWYDNSVANPLNPDPNQSVQFGLQVDEEMMLGYFDWYIP